MKKQILFILALFLSFASSSQNCKIIANSKACAGEPVAFSVQIASGTVTSYSWDFAGVGSSTGAAPTFIFNSPGSKTINLTVNFSGGLSCQTSHVLLVNAVPQTVFYVDSVHNVYCRNLSLVCLDDVTQRSSSGAPLKQRIIVWGDGGLTQNLDPESERYDCHHYYDTGEYEITMELTDTNLCKTSYRRNIRIYPDLVALFDYTTTINCDSVKVCFNNTSLYDSLNPPRFRWYPGDGSVDSSVFQGYCRSFKSTGNFRPSLVLFNQHGCKDSTWAADEVSVHIPKILISKDKYIMCADGAQVNVTATLAIPADYTFILEDSSKSHSILKNTGGINSDLLSIPGPGKWYISVMVKIGNCVRKSQVDSVIVLGPRVVISPLNASQCESRDTVFFCLEKDMYRTHPLRCRFIWDFGDTKAPQCTTDTRNNQNVGQNCNFSRDTGHVKHFYANDSCASIRLYVVDTITGCFSEAKSKVSIGPPDANGLKFKAPQACWSIRKPIEYKIDYQKDSLKPYCGITKVFINYDSARNKDKWEEITTINPGYVYDSVADDSGWVTVGIIAQMGSSLVYDGCVELDTGAVPKICRDTVWYHKLLRLLPEPKPLFFLNRNNGCNPLEVTVSMADSGQRFIRRVKYVWGDGNSDSVVLDPALNHIPQKKHKYFAQGTYIMRVTLENENGCTHSYTRKVSVGYSKYLVYDTIVCNQQPVRFKDSIEYWDFETGNWRDTSRAKKGLESVFWHFGDGTTASGHAPIKIYNDTGRYTVAMVTRDSTGCYDSTLYYVYVVGVKAGIKNMDAEVVCNEIVTFLDSSRKVGAYPGDSVTKYWWDFGDKKIPSVLKNPTHAYTSFGFFTITHVVENIKGCRDTARISIHMEGPVPRFSFIGDSIGCAPFTVKLDNRSDSTTIRDYLWDFDDQLNSTLSTQSDSNVSFTYTSPGIYSLKLTGAKNVYSPATGNTYYCKATYPDIPTDPEKIVIVLAIPQADFNMPDTVCPWEEFDLVDNSDPKYKFYFWRFPDTVLSTVPLVKHRLSKPGDYTVTYTPYYIPGANDRLCVDTVVRKIHVSQIMADFEIDTILSEDPKFAFRNKSGPEAVSYIWDFGHPSSSENNSIVLDPSHNFDPDTGTFMVCLRAINILGCEDTVCKPVHVAYFPHVHYFNVFSPGNSDSLNDVFDIDIKGESLYKLRIYNRWGSLVFESDEDGNDNDGKNWNGRKFNTGEDCPPGTYYYVFDYRILQGEAQRVFGTVTLIRSR